MNQHDTHPRDLGARRGRPLWGLTVRFPSSGSSGSGRAGSPSRASRSRRRCSRSSPRRACALRARPGVVAAGALGYGAVILLQNAGIAHTSVSHAALIVGAVPVLVAVIRGVPAAAPPRPARVGRLAARARPASAWWRAAAAPAPRSCGDLLVLFSVTGSAGLHRRPAQPPRRPRPGRRHRRPARRRRRRRAAARRVTEGAPPAPAAPRGRRPPCSRSRSPAPLLAFSLFAWAQARVGRGGRRVRQPRAARRRHRRGRVFHDAVGPTQRLGARRDPRRDRARQRCPGGGDPLRRAVRARRPRTAS